MDDDHVPNYRFRTRETFYSLAKRLLGSFPCVIPLSLIRKQEAEYFAKKDKMNVFVEANASCWGVVKRTAGETARVQGKPRESR